MQRQQLTTEPQVPIDLVGTESSNPVDDFAVMSINERLRELDEWKPRSV